MANDLRERIIKILEEENPGLLPDEAGWEADSILYRKEIYMRALSQSLIEQRNE